MTGFLRVFASERLKLSRSFIWLLVPVSPLIALVIGRLASLGDVPEGGRYAVLLSAMAAFHALLFLPIMTGILSAFVCRYEHGGGGWKQLLALPVGRTGVYAAKFALVALLLLAAQLLFLAAVLLAATAHDMGEAVPWAMLLKKALVGWLACLPLAALQLWASTLWSSFAAPLVINVMLTLPNILIVNSAAYGPYYPWAQPALAMLSDGSMGFGSLLLPLKSVLVTVLGSFAVFLAGGLVYFNRKEI